jgi:protocatechuate 3,4-dioxygenase beta subunit
MTPNDSSRSRSKTFLLIALCALVCCALFGAWRLLAPQGARSAPQGVAPAPGASAASDIALASATERGAADAPLASSGERVGAATGVRLGGAARLEGNVRMRADGAPVPHARVELHSVPPGAANLIGRVLRFARVGSEMESRVLPVAAVLADERGQFAFEGVRAGRYYIEARGAWCVQEHAQLALVAASGAGGPLTLHMLPGGRVLGRVLDRNGQPASGISIALFHGPGSFLQAARDGELCALDTRANAQGEFELAGVPPGTDYEVSAHGPGFVLTHVLSVAVRGGEDTQLLVRERAGLTIEGVLHSAPQLAQGGATAPVPLAGAHLGALPRGLRDLHFAPEVLRASHVRSAADGSFRMVDVPPGELDLLAWAPEHVAGRGPQLRGVGGQTLRVDGFTLHRGPMVHGRVVDASGAPIAGASVGWNPIDYEQLTQFEFTFAPFLAQAVEGFDFPRTGPDGRFVAGALAGKPPYWLRAERAGYAANRVNWSPAEDGADEDGQEPEEFVIVLSAPIAAEGYVIDAQRSVPVQRFEIASAARLETQPGAPGSLNPLTGGQIVEHEQGRFSVPIEDGVSFSLLVSAEGYASATLSGLKGAGEPLRGLVVRLEPGGGLRGHVRDALGEPVAGALVYALQRELNSRSGAGRPDTHSIDDPLHFIAAEAAQVAPELAAGLGLLAGKAVVSAEDGSFQLDGLPAGELKLGAQHRDYAPVRSDAIAVQLGKVQSGIVLELRRGGGALGRVLDGRERPLAGALVFAATPPFMRGNGDGEAEIYQARSDAEGNYRIERMRPGSYVLGCARGDEALSIPSLLGSSQFDLVTIPEEGMIEQDVYDRSANACRVYGRVLDMPARGGARALVALSFENDSALGVEFKMAQVAADGSYEFAGLAPGNWRFQMEAEGVDLELDVVVPDAAEYHFDVRSPAGRIAGRVIDALTRDPIQGVRVELRGEQRTQGRGLIGMLAGSEANERSEHTDPEGQFELTRLQPGAYRLSAGGVAHGGGKRASYAPSEPIELVLRADEERNDIEIALEPGWSIRGLVRDEQGQPLRGVVVRCFKADGTSVDRDNSGEDGGFFLDGLENARYDLEASRGGYASTWRGEVATSRTSDAAALELVLTRGVEVHARVRERDGRAVVGAFGQLVLASRPERPFDLGGQRFEGMLRGEGVSDAEGRVSLGHYAPGLYRLDLRAGARSGRVDEVRVGTEAGLEVEVVLDSQ